jgi:hypothetical protein
MNPEEATLRAFIRPERRRRYVERLVHARQRLLQQFHHLHDLDPRYAERIEPRQQTPERILELLRERGAPARCHVFSASSELDGQDVELERAIREIVWWHDGTFISCIPGKLAYFEGEEENERYILQR